MNTRNIILDTDIGNDVDDILALVMIAKRRDINLIGVTSVYGDVLLQTKMIRYLLDKLGRCDVPCFQGASEPLENIFAGINRGNHVAGGFPKSLHNINVYNHKNAVDFIIEQAHLHNGSLEIIAIGPLTNIALAMQKDPTIVGKIKQLTTMAGVFENEQAIDSVIDLQGEYNIVCDIKASQIVLNSDVSICMIPLDVTRQVIQTEKELKIISNLPYGVGKIIDKEIKIWWVKQMSWNNQLQYSNHIHDPLAVLALTNSRCLKYTKGKIGITTGEKIKYLNTIVKDDNSNSKVALEVNIEQALQEYINYMIA